MNNRFLGTIAMFGAPFLFIDTLINGHAGLSAYTHTWYGGVFDLIYTTGWLCSIIGLYKIKATGESLIGKLILIIQICLLLMANIWNIYEIVSPGSSAHLYRLLDNFWPLSNQFMIITGLAVAVKSNLKGGKKYTPFLASLWFQLFVVTSMMYGLTQSMTPILIGGLYSAICWLLLGNAIYTADGKEESWVTSEV